MSVKKKLGLPTGKLIAIAGLAGLLAGGAAIYVKESLSGNGAVASADAGACALAAEKAAAITPFSKGEVAAMRTVDEHRPLPDLVFDGPDGKKKTIADFAGKTLLVNLWATWCAPCLKEMPSLDALQKEMGGPDFAVVAINIDTRNLDKPKTWLADNKIAALPFYADPQAATFQVLRAAHKVEGMPVSLIVDKAGCELGIIQGPADWASTEAKALMKAAIGR